MLSGTRRYILFTQILVTITVLFSAAGCVTVDQEMILKEDASGTSALKICVDQKIYQDENFRREYEPLIRNVFDELDSSSGAVTLSRGEKDYDTDHCYEVSHEFRDVNQFGGSSIRFTYGTENNYKVLRSTILVWDDVTPDQWTRFREAEVANSGRLSFRFTFPYPVSEAIGGTISKQTAVWDFPLRQVADSPMRGLGMTAKAPVRSFSIEGTYKIEGGKSNVRLK